MLNKMVRKRSAERVTFEKGQKEVRKEAFQAEGTASAQISKQACLGVEETRGPM